MRFLFIGSRFTLHASFPRSVTLTQLRFTLLTVTSSQRDLHPQVYAHAGRTTKKRPERRLFAYLLAERVNLVSENHQGQQAYQLAQQAGYETAALPPESSHTRVLAIREAPI